MLNDWKFFHIILPRTFHESYIRRTWFLHENSISFSWIIHIVYTLSAYFIHIHMFNIFSPRCRYKISMKNSWIFHKVYIEYLWFFHNFLHKKRGNSAEFPHGISTVYPILLRPVCDLPVAVKRQPYNSTSLLSIVYIKLWNVGVPVWKNWHHIAHFGAIVDKVSISTPVQHNVIKLAVVVCEILLKTNNIPLRWLLCYFSNCTMRYQSIAWTLHGQNQNLHIRTRSLYRPRNTLFHTVKRWCPISAVW